MKLHIITILTSRTGCEMLNTVNFDKSNHSNKKSDYLTIHIPILIIRTRTHTVSFVLLTLNRLLVLAILIGTRTVITAGSTVQYMYMSEVCLSLIPSSSLIKFMISRSVINWLLVCARSGRRCTRQLCAASVSVWPSRS